MLKTDWSKTSHISGVAFHSDTPASVKAKTPILISNKDFRLGILLDAYFCGSPKVLTDEQLNRFYKGTLFRLSHPFVPIRNKQAGEHAALVALAFFNKKSANVDTISCGLLSINPSINSWSIKGCTAEGVIVGRDYQNFEDLATLLTDGSLDLENGMALRLAKQAEIPRYEG